MRGTFHFLGLIVVCVIAYKSLDHQWHRKELSIYGEVDYAEVVDVYCGKNDYVNIYFEGREIEIKAYLDDQECNEVGQLTTIGIKRGANDVIIFANPAYNDNEKVELVSMALLALFFIFAIIKSWFRIEVGKKQNRG